MSVWTYVGQIVNFLLFVVILYYLLYRPVGRIMKARRDEMQADRRDAEKKREEALAAREEAEKLVAELEQKRDRVLTEARTKADQTRQDLLKVAEEQGRERLERFRRIMDQERDELLGKVTDELRDTIVSVASSVVGDLSGVLVERGIDRVRELLDGLSHEELAGAVKSLTETGGRAGVRAAGALDAGAQAKLKEVLTARLGVADVELAVEEDATLVAGLEVTIGHLNLEAHWRGVIDEALRKQAAS